MARPKHPLTERTRAKSQKNRLYWQPNDPHSLDSLQEELRAADQQIPGHIQSLLAKAKQTGEHLQVLFSSEQYQEDVTTPFKVADQQATQIIQERFGNRKHLQHLQWFFALLRRRRLLGRLRAIEAALTLVNGLLSEEETLTQEFLSALPETHTPAAHQDEQAQHKEPPEERAPLSKEEERLQGIEEPLTPLVSSTEQSRRLLTHFEAQLPELRRHLATSNGWFEVFFVPKRHTKRSIMAYATALEQEQTQGRPIPEEIAQSLHPEVVRLLRRGISPLDMPRNLRDEIYDITQLGPYVRYRWREAKHTYTISLGLLDDYPPYPFIPDGF